MSGQLANGTEPRRAYIVDDDDAFRRSLSVLLQSADWETQEFASAGAFISALRELEPGLLLLDFHLGDCTGLDVLEKNSDGLEQFAVVIITGGGEIATAVRSLKAGAADFVEKPFPPGELLDRLNQIYADFTASVTERMARHDARQRVGSLSKRERDVLERLLSGASNKLIARDLDISPRTVEMHRARMLQKLSAANTAEALQLGRLAGVAPVDPTSRTAEPGTNASA